MPLSGVEEATPRLSVAQLRFSFTTFLFLFRNQNKVAVFRVQEYAKGKNANGPG